MQIINYVKYESLFAKKGYFVKSEHKQEIWDNAHEMRESL